MLLFLVISFLFFPRLGLEARARKRRALTASLCSQFVGGGGGRGRCVQQTVIIVAKSRRLISQIVLPVRRGDIWVFELVKSGLLDGARRVIYVPAVAVRAVRLGVGAHVAPHLRLERGRLAENRIQVELESVMADETPEIVILSVCHSEKEGECSFVTRTPLGSLVPLSEVDLHFKIVRVVPIDVVLSRVVESDEADVPKELCVTDERLYCVEGSHVSVRRIDAIGVVREAVISLRDVRCRPCRQERDIADFAPGHPNCLFCQVTRRLGQIGKSTVSHGPVGSIIIVGPHFFRRVHRFWVDVHSFAEQGNGSDDQYEQARSYSHM